MANILVKPPQIRSTAANLREHAKAIQKALTTIEQVFADLPPDRFAGLSSAVIRTRYTQKRGYMQFASSRVFLFAENLEKIAEKFEEADKALNKTRAGIVQQVLGMSTTMMNEPLLDYYRNMRWSSKFEEQKALSERIAELEALIAEGRSADDINKEINQLEQQIADLEDKRSKAKNNADNFLNQVLPDQFPPQANDGDGNPLWRSRADNYEDEIASYDEKLNELRRQRDVLRQEQTIETYNNELAVLQEKQAALQTVMDEGIPADGPTPGDLRRKLGGCVHYVAEKRDVTDWPNAEGKPGHPLSAGAWNDQAEKAGYEVGNLPVRGAIIVYEGGYDPDGSGPKAPVDSAGHVGYVENVTRVEGGYQIEYSHANTIYNSDGSWERGAHKMNANATRFIPDNGVSDISFIYDKPR